MHNTALPKSILKKYPQFEEIFAAIEQFKKTREEKIICPSCKTTIVINENKEEGYLETNCKCGRNKFRMRWNPDKI